MRRSNDPADRSLTPEEARWMDGTLDAEATRRMDRLLAADPARAARLARDRAALDSWVADARRASAGRDAEDLADAVLARVAQGPRRSWGGRGSSSGRTGEVLSPRAAMGYAAAATLLIGLGLGGTWLVRNQNAQAVPATSHDVMAPDPDAPLLDGVSNAIRRGMVRRPSAGTGRDDPADRTARDGVLGPGDDKALDGGPRGEGR